MGGMTLTHGEYHSSYNAQSDEKDTLHENVGGMENTEKGVGVKPWTT